MDNNLIFLLVLLGFYLFRQFLGAQQKAGQKPVPRPRPSGDAEPAFDDALAEIRKALGMDPIPEAEPPVPEPVPVPRMERSRDEFHAVDTGRPDVEERFERGQSMFGDPLKGHTHAKPAKKKTIEPIARPAPGRRRLLATKKQLRDAFVLKEIVGPPRARKKEIR